MLLMLFLRMFLATVVFVDGGIYHCPSLCGDGWNSMFEQKDKPKTTAKNTLTPHSSGDHVSLKNGGAKCPIFLFWRYQNVGTRLTFASMMMVNIISSYISQTSCRSLAPQILLLIWLYKAQRVGFIEMQLISFGVCDRNSGLFRLQSRRQFAVSVL